MQIENKPTDICYKCEKVDDHMTMQYVNQESKYDDRLVCDSCQNKGKVSNANHKPTN